MNIRYLLALCVGFALGAGAMDAAAQTLYKLIDKNGKVTYAEKPPKDYDGKVIRLDIDPNANTATLPKPTAQPEAAARRTEDAGKLAALRERAETARKAYENALANPGEGDLTFIGNKSGGTRPIPSENYAKRLADLEKAAKDAEEELKRAERS